MKNVFFQDIKNIGFFFFNTRVVGNIENEP